jgi:hypothetical protein
MQTFMPYADYRETAWILDRQRLGKQRVEAYQILLALTGKPSRWINHPATKMWAGYEIELCNYAMTMCSEWINRGYKDTLFPRFDAFRSSGWRDNGRPEWVVNDDLLISHRSNLVRKMPEHYGPIWPTVPNDLPYVWPV